VVYMASAKREPIADRESNPQWGPGAKPLGMGFAPEAGGILISDAKTTLKLKR